MRTSLISNDFRNAEIQELRFFQLSIKAIVKGWSPGVSILMKAILSVKNISTGFKFDYPGL